MLIAIDTSTDWTGIALFDGTQILAEQVWRGKHYQSVELVPAIQRMFVKANVNPSQLTGVGVATGPGSFTGLRIGMSVAKGIALAQKLPIAGIPSLDVLSLAQPGLRRPMIAMIELGRGRFAWVRYIYKDRVWQAEHEIKLDDAKGIAATIKSPTYVVGDLNAETRQIMGRKWKTTQLASAALCVRRPAVLAELAWQKIKAEQADDPATLSPIYVHTLSNVPNL
ncbi:MAG: tRNA (adenosine(37)-N6)-threonylcarbamoyltransferase complex dimerization subunit type 1 TsaB [Chloroflexi bacterium]|nr:tRNA (adenosine(37)-N6)-threonylcarbamoyltransferase complex dimerization subunit type 1 TsaB [Chloroflexota bacterium]